MPGPSVDAMFLIVASVLLIIVCWHDLATRLLPDGITLALAGLGIASD